jgi:hypothetical protein
MTYARRGTSLGTIIWVIVGLVVAASHHYLAHANTLKLIVSAILAVLLWPLILLGINLHIK